jgi:hypothetical protein
MRVHLSFPEEVLLYVIYFLFLYFQPKGEEDMDLSLCACRKNGAFGTHLCVKVRSKSSKIFKLYLLEGK